MKSKLDEGIWNYHKRKKNQTDDSGIKKVQQTIRSIEQIRLNHQSRVMYVPLEVNHHSHIYWYINFRNKEKLVECMQKLVQHNVIVSVFPRTKNKVLLITLGDNNSLTKTLSLVEDLEIERILFLDYAKSLKVFSDQNLHKFNYAELFNPIEGKWNFRSKL